MAELAMKKRQGATLATMEGLTAVGLFACLAAATTGAGLIFFAGCALGAGAAWLWRKRGGLRGFSSFKRLWVALILQGIAGILALSLKILPLMVLAGLALGGSAYLFFGAYRDIHRAFQALCQVESGEKGWYMGVSTFWSLPEVGTLGILLLQDAPALLRAAICGSIFCAAGVYILLAKGLCLSDQRGKEICRKEQISIKKI